MDRNVVSYSDGKDFVSMDPEHQEQLGVLRSYMFENVYRSQRVKKEEDLAKVDVVIRSLYEYFLKHPEKLPGDLRALVDVDGLHVAVKDYIAGMTDRFALNLYGDLFVPKAWR